MRSVSRFLQGALILTILICVGIYFYIQWDQKKFEESLPKAPPVASTHEKSLVAQEDIQEIHTETTEAGGERINYDVPAPSATSPPDASDVTEELDPTPDTVDLFFEEFLQETDTNASESIGISDSVEETTDPLNSGDPYDQEVVKIGFEDYNAYLSSDPEYAYQRLDDAFREQYGDSPHVDTLVEGIRKSNDRTLTVDAAIEMTNAVLNLMPPDEPEEVISQLSTRIEFLQELKALEDEGETIELIYNYRIGD